MEETVTIQERQKRPDQWIFDVTVKDDRGISSHVVEVDTLFYNKVTQERETPAELVERSFEFLLAREEKETILPRFNLKQIKRFFSDYEAEITL